MSGIPARSPLPVTMPASSRRRFLKHTAAAALAAPLVGPLAAVQDRFRQRLRGLDVAAHTAATFGRLRAEYLLAPDVIYLNHASIGTVPQVVHQAHASYLAACEANPWLYMWGDAWEDARAAGRAQAAAVLGTVPDRVAILHNTTEAFNLLAQGLPLGPGDEVVFSTLNHPGASIPFQQAAQTRGFEVKRFEVKRFEVPAGEAATPTETALLERYDAHLSPRTKLLVVPHLDNAVGLRHPLAKLTALARDRGVDFVAVDAAQTVGMIPVDVEAAGVDLFATSAHKWLQAPKGLGLAYLSPALQAVLRPMWVTWGQDRWAGTARIYEDYGTRDLPAVLALGDAIAFQAQLDPTERERRLRTLWAFTQRLADETPGTTWRSPRAWGLGGSLYAIEVKAQDSGALFERLYTTHGFVFRPFQFGDLHTVRLSPNIFTSEDEIARFFDAVSA